MNKAKLWISIITILILFSASAFAYADSTSLNSGIVSDHDQKQLAIMNIQFQDSTIIGTQNLVSKDLALENAKKIFPAWANDATQTKIEFHLVTNKTFKGFSKEALSKNSVLKTKGFMDKIPAYVISYVGMSYTANIPADFKGEVPIHHEYNVIVDATTGEPLMGFSYR